MPMFAGLRHKFYLLTLRLMAPLMPGSTHVAFVGSGSAARLCQHIATLAPNKVLIVTDKPLRDLGIADQATAALPAALPGDAVDNPAYETTEPDQALWSESRKQQYELARQAVDGPPVAVLSIDHLGIEVPVYDGTSEDVLKRGVGRIEGTARVDHEGNLGIAGHRDSFFRPLKDIEIGDMMELQTGDGIVTYAVSSIEIVEPEDVFVLAPTSERTLTLVTCYPFYYVGHAPKRYIVKATAEHSFGQNLK